MNFKMILINLRDWAENVFKLVAYAIIFYFVVKTISFEYRENKKEYIKDKHVRRRNRNTH
mgnify:FL=1